jgi:MFS family permease
LRPSQGIFYGWWLTGVAAFVMIIGTVPIFQGMTAWFVVLEREFGWSRAQLSLAFSLTRAEGTIMGPLAGYLVDKVGPRRMVLSGLPVMGIGFILFSQVNNLWQFYGAFVLASMGAGFGTWLPMMTVLNHWFQKRRSMAMSLAMEGFALGGVLLMPALAWAIDPDEPDRLGWRLTAAGIGVVLIILAWPVSRLIRNRPEEYGLRPDGRPENQPERGERVGSGQGEGGIVDFTWQEALRTRPFWLITIGHSATSIVIVTLTVHLGPMLTDLGYSLQMVAWVVSTYTGVGAVFTLVGGYIGDRVPMHLALFGFSVIQSVAVVILLSADTLPMILLFAVVLGIGFGGRTPMTTAIRGVYFGRRAFASITGISMIPMNIMLLVFPLFAGIMFDAVGSYQIPFSVLAIVSFFGAAMFLLLGKPSLKVG